MDEYLIQAETLKATADAIRAKTGDTAPIMGADIPVAIRGIEAKLEEAYVLFSDSYENVYFEEGATWQDYINSTFNQIVEVYYGPDRFLDATSWGSNGLIMRGAFAVTVDGLESGLVTTTDKIIAGHMYDMYMFD